MAATSGCLRALTAPGNEGRSVHEQSRFSVSDASDRINTVDEQTETELITGLVVRRLNHQ